MAKRKQLSVKTRFDVFKRDKFCCQYCGAHPPEVLLHIDHVTAVKNGGENDIDNLVTACQACNLGKGARALNVVPETLSEKAMLVSEREAQLLGYQTILDAKRERIEDEMWRVAEVIESGSSESGMKRDWLASIKRFNEKLGVHEVLDAAEIARAKFSYGGPKAFRYFCGICWNILREKEAA